MTIDEFLYNLHFDIDKVRPPDTEVDWDDAPLSFKLYQDLPYVELPHRVSGKQGTLTGTGARRQTTLTELGDFLWYCYGLTRLCHVALPEGEEGQQGTEYLQQLRRFVPSGGALYPSELYAYLKIAGLPVGVYHYDVAHHRLILLRNGDVDDYLRQALAYPLDIKGCFGALFVSTMFWKNYYKYKDFAYRLQAFDAGALIGQIIEAAREFGYMASVRFQFLDEAVNHLLGLKTDEESVYAVLPLTVAMERGKTQNDDKTFALETPDEAASTTRNDATKLSDELPALVPVYYRKSKRVQSSPMILAVTEACKLESVEEVRALKCQSASKLDDGGGPSIPLPDIQSVQYSFASACNQRYSPSLDFVPKRVSLDELSTLLKLTFAERGFNTDLYTEDAKILRVEEFIGVACCTHDVANLSDGAYTYNPGLHQLQMLRSGDHRLILQYGMTIPTVNLFQVPLCFHLVGLHPVYGTEPGYRAYRIQQMAAGILLQRLLLSAAALGMAGHALLGFDVAACDEIYQLDVRGKTCLIQVPVGPYQKSLRYETPLKG